MISHRYLEKKTPSLVHHSYIDGKEEYALTRDQLYTLDSKRAKDLRDSIKRLEDLLKRNRTVYCTWKDDVMMQIMFSNGVMVNVGLQHSTAAIQRITFDRFFVGKLVSETITDVIVSKTHILIAYDLNQITFVSLHNAKKSASQKINKQDPKIFNIIIGGSSMKKVSRRLAINNTHDLLAIWTKSSQNEVYPWRPTVHDQDRANIHIYRLGDSKMELFCFYWTENDPIHVDFSKSIRYQIRSIEQKISRKVSKYNQTLKCGNIYKIFS